MSRPSSGPQDRDRRRELSADEVASEAAGKPGSSSSNDAPLDLAHLVALTERVEAAVAAGDWLEAAGLETERRNAIAAALTQGGGTGLGRDASDALAGLLSRTHRMIGTVSHQRRQLLFDASAARAGRAAADEYESVAGSE